ncbi:MAG: ATP-binding protein, partial [Pirellulaceae bacterium]|nr:ATP-binding protein [Pirellulaceae bacterium]
FYTSKEVGQGTGQGLAIAQSVIVEKHGGTLRFKTEIGEGTTFIVRIPFKEEPKTTEMGEGNETSNPIC